MGSGHGRTKLQPTVSVAIALFACCCMFHVVNSISLQGKKLKKNTNSTGSLTSDELYLPTGESMLYIVITSLLIGSTRY